MNERIKLLEDQCYEYKAEMPDIWFNKEKFAELIVRECIRIDINNPDAAPGVEIAKHFGVEE